MEYSLSLRNSPARDLTMDVKTFRVFKFIHKTQISEGRRRRPPTTEGVIKLE